MLAKVKTSMTILWKLSVENIVGNISEGEVSAKWTFQNLK